LNAKTTTYLDNVDAPLASRQKSNTNHQLSRDSIMTNKLDQSNHYDPENLKPIRKRIWSAKPPKKDHNKNEVKFDHESINIKLSGHN